jgi:rhodanese-related sulfurtransferase
VVESEPVVIDLRDPISFREANLQGSSNVSHNLLRDNLERVPEGETILLISDDGQKGHVALRMLKAAGFEKVHNLSGGFISLERHGRAVGFKNVEVDLFGVEHRAVSELLAGEHGHSEDGSAGTDAVGGASGDENATQAADAPDRAAGSTGRLIVDVRTPMEFHRGAYPGAINIELDNLQSRLSELGATDREIIVYCASGARSAYAQRVLSQMGYTNVRNGGGLHDMMSMPM